MSRTPLKLSRFYRDAVLSVTDFSFYRTVFQQRLSRTFFFFVFLVVNSAVAQSVAYGWTYLPAAQRFLKWVEENFPPLEFQGGVLEVAGDEPLVRKYLSREIHTFVFDTSGQRQPLYKLDQPAYVLTRDNLYVLRDGNTQTWSWASLRQGAALLLGSPEAHRRIDPHDWAEWRRLLPWALFPALLLGFLIEEASVRLLQGLLLTFFGMSASIRLGVRLPFWQYFTISLYSLTPAVALRLIVAVSGQSAIYYDLICLAMAALYTYKATQKCVIVE